MISASGSAPPHDQAIPGLLVVLEGGFDHQGGTDWCNWRRGGYGWYSLGTLLREVFPRWYHRYHQYHSSGGLSRSSRQHSPGWNRDWEVVR
jgi:hypothetical protein